jgi:hypothetical protein
MSLFLTDFEQWYDAYEAAAPSQQYGLIQAAIAQPIAVEYAEENDFGRVLLADRSENGASYRIKV